MIASLLVALAFAEGGDYSPKELEYKGLRVEGVRPVHGYHVNWEDVFFYQGDGAKLNRFIAAYAKLEGVKHKAVIHVGRKMARSPWDGEDRPIAVDWSCYTWNTGIPQGVAGPPGAKPAPSRIDLWLSERIKLEDLEIPMNVEVVSGGEIEKFILERHRKAGIDPTIHTPQSAADKGAPGKVQVEFTVAAANALFGPVPAGSDHRMPIRLSWDGKLEGGGAFYVMLRGDAAGGSPGDRCKELKGKKVRVTGILHGANADRAEVVRFIEIDDLKSIEIVK